MPDHSLSRLILSSQAFHPLTSFCGYREYNEGGKEPPEPKETPKETPKEEPKEKPNEYEGRISELANANKDLKKQLKELQDAQKKREEDELAQKGEHEKLAKQREEERDNAFKERDSASEKATKYEKLMQDQINRSLESVTDEEKRKSAEALLAGLSVEAQFEKLPEVLKLLGSAGNSGMPTPPGKHEPGKTSTEHKRARYAELLKKPDLTPQEKVEMNRLMFDLSDQWNQGKA